MAQPFLAALPQDLPVLKGQNFGRTKHQTIPSPMPFIRLEPLLETARTVPVQQGRNCLLYIVRRMGMRQALERDGQLDLELRILKSHPQRL
jgi:hypothetical protein